MFLLLSTLLVAAPAPQVVAPADTGWTKNGVTMAETIDVEGHTLTLNGMALRTKTFLKVKVYVGGLYLVTPSHSAEEILAADAPRRMVMHFVTGRATKDKMCGAWNDGLKDNTPNASEQLKQEFTQLCGMMRDIKNGEDVVITYVPGSGTSIEIGGTMMGNIAGKDFADAVLRCWIGPKPDPGEGFKKDVLGQG